jgi:hypothetical protein
MRRCRRLLGDTDDSAKQLGGTLTPMTTTVPDVTVKPSVSYPRQHGVQGHVRLRQ